MDKVAFEIGFRAGVEDSLYLDKEAGARIDALKSIYRFGKIKGITSAPATRPSLINPKKSVPFNPSNPLYRAGSKIGTAKTKFGMGRAPVKPSPSNPYLPEAKGIVYKAGKSVGAAEGAANRAAWGYTDEMTKFNKKYPRLARGLDFASKQVLPEGAKIPLLGT